MYNKIQKYFSTDGKEKLVTYNALKYFWSKVEYRKTVCISACLMTDVIVITVFHLKKIGGGGGGAIKSLSTYLYNNCSYIFYVTRPCDPGYRVPRLPTD